MFSFFATLIVVFSLIIFKGVSGDGQISFFNNLIRRYIEETSASITGISNVSQHLEDISTLSALSYNSLGQGGEEPTTSPATIQETSFLANNPVSTDYIETSGFKRSQVVEYEVQPDDLVSFIASDYGVSINSILWANNLRSADNIHPGQILRIPPVSGVIHKIKKGDTIESIAKKYSVEGDKIIAFNSLPKEGNLQLDDEIIIPDGQIKSTSALTGTGAISIAKRFSYLPDLGSYYLTPTTGFNWGRIHGRNGVDVANSCGTPIYAAADGNAALAIANGWNGGFGKHIKLVHSNGTETLYGHLSKLLISQGTYIAKGQLIGYMGTTGRSTGCHLHFEVHGARNPLAKY